MKIAAIVRRSFIAMFWGWVACNAATVVLTVVNGNFSIGRIQLLLQEMAFWAVSTAVVIFAAWVCIFLPVDVIVKETSVLRTPKWAAPTGGLAGFLALFGPCVGIGNGSADMSDIFLMSLLAAICGLTASLHLVLHHSQTAGIAAVAERGSARFTF